MIDRKTEVDIKALGSFLEFWGGFHSLYKEMTAKGVITKADDDRFVEAASSIRAKYEDLRKGLEFNYMPHGRMTDPVADILSIDGVHFMSEKRLKKTEEAWRDSYIFLNNISERLKNKRRRLGQFSPVRVFLKRFWERRRDDDEERDSS